MKAKKYYSSELSLTGKVVLAMHLIDVLIKTLVTYAHMGYEKEDQTISPTLSENLHSFEHSFEMFVLSLGIYFSGVTGFIEIRYDAEITEYIPPDLSNPGEWNFNSLQSVSPSITACIKNLLELKDFDRAINQLQRIAKSNTGAARSSLSMIEDIFTHHANPHISSSRKLLLNLLAQKHSRDIEPIISHLRDDLDRLNYS